MIDTHSAPVHAPVWAIYEAWIAAHGARPTLIEWDADIPPVQVLLQDDTHLTELGEHQRLLAGIEQVGQNHIGASVGQEIKLNALLAVGVSKQWQAFAQSEITDREGRPLGGLLWQEPRLQQGLVDRKSVV
mgnify:CR=1 FL=1